MKINFNVATLPKFRGTQNNNTGTQNKLNHFNYCEFDSFTKKVEANRELSSSKTEPKWNLDNFILDYELSIYSVREGLVIPAIKEKAGIEADIPNCILLDSDSISNKLMFSIAVADEMNADLITLESGNFIQNVTTELEKARERYLKTHKRTIILLPEAEICLKGTPENQKNIEQMKKWVEHSAEIPSDKNPNAYATTFFLGEKDCEISDKIDFFSMERI